MIKALIVILIILGVIFLVGGGYFLGVQNSSNTPSPSPSVAPAPSSSPPEIPAVSPLPSIDPNAGMSDKTSPGGPQLGDVLGPNDAQRAIEKAIESQNFDKVEPNLADKVLLIQYGTSCCGETSDTTKVIDFISGKAKSGEAPWVFNPADNKYSDLKKSSDFFAVDKSGKALAFNLDGDNKTKSIYFYTDYRLAGE